MKKSLLKEKLAQFISTTTYLLGALSETQEALDRRRALYDRIVSHRTQEQPKSMRDMAESLYLIFADKTTPDILPFEELTEKEQDLWMNRLLNILD